MKSYLIEASYLMCWGIGASLVNIVVGSHVWVEDPVLAWLDGEVIRINGQEVHVKTTNGKKILKLRN
ncbi:myosin-17 [Quercus suber]|uniref:Myosin-17 n=1 Tax=Quercus suber TaxID=58331 RepID=A0AAW0M0C8_QUESU